MKNVVAVVVATACLFSTGTEVLAQQGRAELRGRLEARYRSVES